MSVPRLRTRDRKSVRQKKVAFSTMEDNFLFSGLKKYGGGK